jgi:lysophospholipase L1-like esterase
MLDEHIRATGIEPWDLYIDEIHFSPDGYVVVADTLCRFLRDHDLLGN